MAGDQFVRRESRGGRDVVGADFLRRVSRDHVECFPFCSDSVSRRAEIEGVRNTRGRRGIRNIENVQTRSTAGRIARDVRVVAGNRDSVEEWTAAIHVTAIHRNG